MTCADVEGFVIDDDLLEPHFLKNGWKPESVVWDDPALDWKRFDRVVIRTTWDYTKSPDLFLKTLEVIERSGVPLANPLSVVRWNARKTYLLELERRGVPIVPTTLAPGFTQGFLDESFKRFGGEALVVKPTVSANADRTFVVRRGERPSLENDLGDVELMIQPFLEEITSVGEDSLFFFNGTFSHAVRKVPKGGDFRVQEDHGGLITSSKPAPEMLALAEKAVKAAPGGPLLYARADIVRSRSKGPLLMELELIEPALYLRTDPRAAENFVAAFLNR